MRTTQNFAACVVLMSLSAASAHEFVVRPGQSIQSAVDRANPGDQIKVLPGLYREIGRTCPTRLGNSCAIVITKDNIALTGASSAKSPVIIENSGKQTDGVVVGVPGADVAGCVSGVVRRVKGSRISGITVRGFDDTGILVSCAENFTIANTNTVDNRLYGLFPVASIKGTVVRNEASGSNDTGIYVGQSFDVVVEKNVAHGNVSGFEIENSVGVVMRHNESFGNTAGLLAFIIPGDTLEVNRGNRIADNYVHDNNKRNTCAVPGDDVCLVPPGIGISAAGGSANVFDRNVVENNRTVGLSLVDVCTAFQIPPKSCNLGYNPQPESTRITFNLVVGNGTKPAPGFPAADFYWNGGGRGNCWRENAAKIVIPSPLPKC